MSEILGQFIYLVMEFKLYKNYCGRMKKNKFRPPLKATNGKGKMRKRKQ